MEFIYFRKNPANGPIATANENSEGVKVTEEPQTETGTTVHQIKDLGRIEKLLESAKKFNPLVIA